jgi:putative transposase
VDSTSSLNDKNAALHPTKPAKQNAVAESFFSTLKNELVHHQTYHTRVEASREIFAFIEGFYNRQRLHQSLRHLTPLAFEQRVSDS